MKRTILFTSLALTLTPVQGENLIEVYRLAQQHDQTLAQAAAGHQASVERGEQDKGLVLPTLVFAASHMRVGQEVTSPAQPSPAPPPPYEYNYNNETYLLQLTQPLFRRDSFAAYTKGKATISRSEAEFAIAQGDLMLRVVQTYFDVLAAEDALTLARAEKNAIQGQMALAQRNFSVGSASVVDVHDARARYDVAVSQEITAETELNVRRDFLSVLINRQPGPMARLAPTLNLVPPDPADVDAWNTLAMQYSPQVMAQERAVQVAEAEVDKNRGTLYPSLDFVASHGHNKTGLYSTSNIYEYTTTQAGLQLTVPIYAGGIAQSKTREAEAKREQARASLELTRRTTTRQIREAYLSVSSSMARVRALEQSRLSSKRALESTLIGYESGVRTGSDVLNTQQAYYRNERDLSLARYNYLLSHMKLKLVAGTLSEKDLDGMNSLLTSP